MLVVHQDLPKVHFNTFLHCSLGPRLNLKRAKLSEYRGLIDDRFSLHTEIFSHPAIPVPSSHVVIQYNMMASLTPVS